MKKYEVYFCKLGGEIVYIGSGQKGRHRHCNSGTSHVYDLNKGHFRGVVFDIEVKLVDSKQEALDLEVRYIRKYKPKYNKNFLGNGGHVSATLRLMLKSKIKKRLYQEVKFKTRKWQTLTLNSVLDEIFSEVSHLECTENKGLMFLPYSTYQQRRIKNLAWFLRRCYDKEKSGKVDDFSLKCMKIIQEEFDQVYHV